MIETDEDRALFFADDGFGESALVTIGDAAPVSVLVIFDTRPPFTAANFKGARTTDDFGRDLGSVAGNAPRISGPTAALAGVKVGRGLIVVRGVSYLPYRVSADGTGVTVVDLKEAD